jgi:hypothetical protein
LVMTLLICQSKLGNIVNNIYSMTDRVWTLVNHITQYLCYLPGLMPGVQETRVCYICITVFTGGLHDISDAEWLDEEVRIPHWRNGGVAQPYGMTPSPIHNWYVQKHSIS